jgi:hypothetical protein
LHIADIQTLTIMLKFERTSREETETMRRKEDEALLRLDLI